MYLKTIKQVVRHNLCVGCGLCSLDKKVSIIEKNGVLVPDIITDSEEIEKSCPSKGYDLKMLGYSIFGDVSYKFELGYYRHICLAHTNRTTVLKNASSGGMITEVAINLLSDQLIDGVISTKFIVNKHIVRTEVYIATTEEELIRGQGSKYCPTSTLSILKLLDPQKKYLLIGTPCQIAGFRLFSIHNKSIKEQIPYTIANFCGGYRDYRELDYFISSVAHISDVKTFRHRGGGNPGV